MIVVLFQKVSKQQMTTPLPTDEREKRVERKTVDTEKKKVKVTKAQRQCQTSHFECVIFFLLFFLTERERIECNWSAWANCQFVQTHTKY